MHTLTSSPAIENYLKEIFKLSGSGSSPIKTTDLASALGTAAPSVTDMLVKLSGKGFLRYRKYKGVTLTRKGNGEAIRIIRKHRLWEKFLAGYLGFSWDEVHEVAEQLEHIQSDKLTARLDKFLKFPKFDPHGDPIPDKNGKLPMKPSRHLSDLNVKETCITSGIVDHSPAFLKYINRLGIGLGCKVEVVEKNEYDRSLKVRVNKTEKKIFISHDVAKNILVGYASL